MYLVYCMTCKYMLGQCCPNANGNAGLRAGGLRAEGQRLGMYDNCRECMIVYSWCFLLNKLVSAATWSIDEEDERSWWVFSRLYYVNLTTMIINLSSFFQVAGVWVLFCCVCWWMTSSSARLAIPEVVDRPCWNRVKSAYWSGDFLKIFFLFDPSLTSGMSVVLMWGHCLRHRPYIKQHMSAGRVAHRKRLRHRQPHLIATCVRVELMVSQRRRQRANIKKTFFEKLMNIQYLNAPPTPIGGWYG